MDLNFGDYGERIRKEIEYKVEYISGRLFTPFFRRKTKGWLKGILQQIS